MRRGPEGAQNGQPPKLRSRWSPGRPDFPARLGAAKSPGLADLPDLGLSRLPSLPLPPASASASTFARLEAPPDLRASTPSRQRRPRSDQIASPHWPASCPGLFASPDFLCARSRLSRLRIGRNEGLPTHPPEPAYPCCLPALGEFCEVTPHEEPRSSLRHNRHPRQRGRRQCSNGPRLGNGSPQGNGPRRPGQRADATADRISTPFQTSEHRLAFSAAARRQYDNQKSTTSPFLNAGLAITRGPARCVRGHVDDSAHVQNFGYACGAHCAPGGFA